MKLIDLTNKTFGRLTVISRAENNSLGQARWLCKCSCGKTKEVLGSNLRRGLIVSCGCYKNSQAKERLSTHKQSKTRLYRIYHNMLNRCYYEHNDNYKWYGNKGIKVCAEWKNSFEAFLLWANKHGYTENLTLDRIDSTKDYSPENCRWVTIKRQQNNRKDNVYIVYNGKKQTLSDWSKDLGINRVTLWNRLFHSKWSIDKAFNTKVSKETCSGKNKDSSEPLDKKAISGGR